MPLIAQTQIFLADDDPGASLQIRLREAISRAVWDGRFAPGDRLPATRALARHLGIARITVSLAYDDLVTAGYAVAHARSGFFIAPDAPRRLAVEPEAPGRDDPAAVDWAARLGPAPPALGPQAKPADWRRYRYPFVFGMPDNAGFPLEHWRAAARQALGRRSFDAIADDFGDRDDPMLVAEIVRRSLPGRGIAAAPEEVLVTHGATNALWLVANLLGAARPGFTAAVEEPGYPDLRNLLTRMGARIVPVPVDAEGLDPGALPDRLDAVFVTPSHQAPTGVTMTMARRRALLDLAAARDFVVVEDDYDFETSYLRPHSPALKSLDRAGRVLYVGSFSKSLFPGLRLGYLVAPTPAIARARALRTLEARHLPGLTQRAAAYFLALGYYNAYTNALRDRMAGRREVLLASLAEAGLAPSDGNTFGGASLWIAAPAGTDTGALAARLKPEGVLIEPGAPFFAAPQPPRHFMRLGFSAIGSDRIPEGVARIAKALRAR